MLMSGYVVSHFLVLWFGSLGDRLDRVKECQFHIMYQGKYFELGIYHASDARKCCTADPRRLVLENLKTRKDPDIITQSRKSLSDESGALVWAAGRCCTGRGISIIPIPRDATSVATMMGLLPVLNSFRTQSRSFCCLSPWMAI